MGGRADGQTHLHRITHADALEEGRQDDRADDTRDDDRDSGERGHAAEHFGQRNGDRCCYRLRNERKRGALTQAEQMAEHDNTGDGHHRADERAEQDGQQVFHQHIQLAVDGDGECDGRRCEEERNELAGFLVGLVARAGEEEQRTDQNGGDEQRIAQRRTGLFLDLHAERIECDGNEQPELGRG